MIAGTVPSKLLLQLKTVLQKGCLRNRSGAFVYKDHLSESKVPVLAIAGDKDLICPPEAVYGIQTSLTNPLNA
jgi:pimeloyl-ACP methyl ester carboxylesterase